MITVKYISDTPGRMSRFNTKISKDYGFEVDVDLITMPSYHWFRTYERMSKGDNKWNNIQVIEPSKKEADYYAIINHPFIPNIKRFIHPDMDYYEPEKTIVFQIEPQVVRDRSWGDWHYVNPKDYFKVMTIEHFRCFGWWEVDIKYSDLWEPIVKEKCISAVSTGKTYYPGHQHRVDIISSYLRYNRAFDLYGRLQPEHKASKLLRECNYVRELPSRDKREALLPYEYHFCCENSCEKNYFTEKIMDAFICEALPFYWGCPNITDFFPKESMILLDMNDKKKSYEKIESVIKNDEYKNRLPYIRKAKKLIADKYNLFPTLEAVCSQ